MRGKILWLTVVISLAILAETYGAVSDALEAFVTKDDQVYVGKVVIRTEETIVVRTEKGNVTLDKNDLLDLSETELEARRLLYQAKQAKAEADKAYLVNDLGKASHYYDIGLISLASIDASAKEQSEAAKELIDQITAKVKDLSAILSARGLTAYHGQVFKKPVLDYHLDEGHILIGSGVWIKPSQLCNKCESKGMVRCLKCAGGGLLTIDCPDCQGGWITCPNCKGSGQLSCPKCKGTGGHWTAACNFCSGTGEITSRCKSCHGRGELKDRCDFCRGRRYVTRKILVTDDSGEKKWLDKHFICPLCHGLGYNEITCPDCHGTGTITVTCRHCHGIGEISGYCTNCNGSGYVPCCKFIACRKCQATGKIQEQCENCGGKGYITCPNCSGKGYTGEPCPDPPKSHE